MNKQELLNAQFEKFMDKSMAHKAKEILESKDCSEEAFLGAKAVLMLHGMI